MRKKTFIILLFVITAFLGCTQDDLSGDVNQFLATYSVTETWAENGTNVTKPVFTMTILPSVIHGDGLLLNNFGNYGAGITADATFIGNQLTIQQQTLPNLKSISGSGILLGPTMTFTYTEVFNGKSVDVSVTATKK